MIWYEGVCGPLRKYMPQKPQKWINKVSSMTSFVTKFIWNFAIYHGKKKDVEKVAQVAHGELQLAYKRF
jgi:undecaprenyl pyrophosphate synthase